MSDPSLPDYPAHLYTKYGVPDDALVRKALAFASNHSAAYAYNHVQRSLLFGFIIAGKLPHLRDRDVLVHAVGAILHDIGWDPTAELVSTDKRFEVDGADAARDFLLKEGAEGAWDKHRIQLVWDAIALHTTGSIVFHKEPEVQAVSYGIWADFQGPDRIRGPPGLLTWEEYWEVVAHLPRLGLMQGLKGVMCQFCLTKPDTTYDNTVGEWGDRYLDRGEYSREGKLTQDLLETCDLDEREVPAEFIERKE